MTKSENLLDRINRIADAGATYEKGRRILTAAEGVSALSALLQEIDETILARELTFHNDSGQNITLIAKGRRLWRINAAKPKTMVPKGAEILAVNLSGDETDAMKAISQLMQKFTAETETLSVSIAETGLDSDYSAMGIPSRTLWELMDVKASAKSKTVKPAKELRNLTEFVQEGGKGILASVIKVGEKELFNSGAEKQIKFLNNMIDKRIPGIREEFKKPRVNIPNKSLITLDRDQKYFIAFARYEKQLALMVCKPDSLGDIVSNWQQLVG